MAFGTVEYPVIGDHVIAYIRPDLGMAVATVGGGGHEQQCPEQGLYLCAYRAVLISSFRHLVFACTPGSPGTGTLPKADKAQIVDM